MATAGFLQQIAHRLDSFPAQTVCGVPVLVPVEVQRLGIPTGHLYSGQLLVGGGMFIRGAPGQPVAAGLDGQNMVAEFFEE